MLNHTYTSVKNANLVDCGKKQHISSQPTSLLKDNFLGEFRTDLEKKKVLANLGIATELSLEWQYIKGDIGGSEALMQELDSRTTYIARIGEFKDKVISVIEGIQYLETIVRSEQEGETVQNERLTELENKFKQLVNDLDQLNEQLNNSIKTDIEKLNQDLEEISKQIANINDLIQISSKANNALVLIPEDSDQLAEGETPGLYVPNLEPRVEASEKRFEPIETNIESIQSEIESVKNNYVTKESLGGEGDFNFVKQTEYDSYINQTNTTIGDIQTELNKTVKNGEDGHVANLQVNQISKTNDSNNIKLTDSFEVTEGIPLDVRAVVEDLDKLCNLPVNICYPGMGVIVNSLSSLYILKNPEEGTRLTQEYINDIYNWKCPEDLVTVALSQSEYNQLEEINPNVFYYIYEEKIKLTQEPKRENFGSEKEFLEAWQLWTDSLKILSQEYMSASWGVKIENKLGEKADQVDVNSLNQNVKDLQEQINALSGGDNENSLSALSERLTETESELDFLLGTEGTDEEPSSEGKIFEIENTIKTLDTKVTEEYVSKASITTESDDTTYIFIKKSEYNQDMENRDTAMKEGITTNKATVSLIETNQVTIAELPITSNGADLLVNDKEVALIDDVPKIVYLTQAEYDALESSGELDSDTYYYTTNEEVYVTKTEFNTKTSQLNTYIQATSSSVTELSNTIQQQQVTIETLLSEIESLKGRLEVLEGTSKDDTEQSLA